MKRTFRHFWIGLNVVAGGLWLVGYVAAYVNPTYFWIGAILAVGLPFVSLALIPFAILHATRKRWLWFGLHFLAVCLAVNRHWSVDRLSLPDAMRGDRTLMTFNTPRHPDTDEAMQHVNDLVRGVQPDLIAIQESIVFASKSDPEKLRAHAKFRTVVDSMNYSAKPPTEGPEGASWVRWVQPVLSIDPIASQQQLTFGRDIPGWPTLYVLRTQMKYESRDMAHYNVHLFTYGPSKPWGGDGDWLRLDRWITFLSEVRTAFRVRAWQAEQVRNLIEKETLPVVVSGDFNGTADNWTYRHIARGLQDAFRVAGSGWGGTYHAKYPFLRIDFVLFGPEFEVVKAAVPYKYEVESDHRPLVARFRWRGPA